MSSTTLLEMFKKTISVIKKPNTRIAILLFCLGNAVWENAAAAVFDHICVEARFQTVCGRVEYTVVVSKTHEHNIGDLIFLKEFCHLCSMQFPAVTETQIVLSVLQVAFLHNCRGKMFADALKMFPYLFLHLCPRQTLYAVDWPNCLRLCLHFTCCAVFLSERMFELKL